MTVFYLIWYGSSTLHAVFKNDKCQIFLEVFEFCNEVRKPPTPSNFDYDTLHEKIFFL